MFETVYHGVPVVTMPVFCDHDSNAAKAEVDGYAFKLDLLGLTSKNLLNAINRVIRDPKYKESVKHRQMLLKDQKDTPLDTAVYWVEYVLRHHGAGHFFSPGRNLNFMQYYSVDSYAIILISLILFISLQIWLLKSVLRYFIEYITMPRKVKGDWFSLRLKDFVLKSLPSENSNYYNNSDSRFELYLCVCVYECLWIRIWEAQLFIMALILWYI